MAEELLGKPVIDSIKEDLTARIGRLAEAGVTPTLALIRVGERPDDLAYERTALKRAEGLGIRTERFVFPETASTREVADAVAAVNADPSIHGCLMFRPLPAGIDEEYLCMLLDPDKDVDGITQVSLGSVFTGSGEGFPPSTAQACLEMLNAYDVPLEGAKIAVLGRSLVIGRPVAMMALEANATVTLCHSKTQDLIGHVQDADIVICATGRPRAYGPDCFREGQIVLDVGINVDADGGICGDVDYESVAWKIGDSGAITPVPGGIGGVTTSVTMAHVVAAAEAALSTGR